MKRTRWTFGLAAVVVTGFALAAGTSPSDKTPSGAAIKIDDRSFDPENISIAAGVTVTWTNNDDVPHVVVSDDNKIFKSETLHTDDHFSFTFTEPGTYNYHCSIHPKMTGKIAVQ
jgi:plastocyanin